MDPISTLPGPVNSGAFVDGSSTASGAATLAEIAQLLNKTNEVIGGLTTVAGDLDTAEAAITDEASARSSGDAALAADIAASDANIAILLTGFSDHTGLIQGLDGRLEDVEYVIGAGYLNVSSGNKTLEPETERTINFTGTSGSHQSLSLPSTMTGFEEGKEWTVVCNNEDGVMISSSAWAHSSLTGGVANLNLLVGDIAKVVVVEMGGTKKWSAAILRGVGGFREAAALAGDLGAADDDDRSIWVNRTGDTGTRDLYLPELGGAGLYRHGLREITVVLYGTPTSGTFVINCQGTDVFIDGATTFTMTEKSALRLIGNDSSKRWAAIVGGAM